MVFIAVLLVVILVYLPLSGVLMPFTVIKARFESDLFNYRSVSQALLQISRHEGIKVSRQIRGVRDRQGAVLNVNIGNLHSQLL